MTIIVITWWWTWWYKNVDDIDDDSNYKNDNDINDNDNDIDLFNDDNDSNENDNDDLVLNVKIYRSFLPLKPMKYCFSNDAPPWDVAVPRPSSWILDWICCYRSDISLYMQLRYYKGISSLQLNGLVVFDAEYQSLISYIMPHILKTDF